MDRKILKNYIYNILYQLVKVILPLIVVPYTAHHIGAKTLGIYNFAGTVMNWFILFGILGVNTYGNRQIAKIRDNKEELSRTFLEILAMQMTNMMIAMIAYFVYIQMTVASDSLFFYRLTGCTMFASMLDISWLYYGVEDFKKASIRNIVVKIIGVALIMTFVKSPSDLALYIIINVGSELLGQAIMFAQLKQYIHFTKISLSEAYRHHFKATFQLFVPTIAIAVYTMLDQTMIGYLYSEEHVTYYFTSMNLIKIFLYFITSIGSVMLPRITNIFYNRNDGTEQTRVLVHSTMKIALLLALPMCFGMMAITPDFISWFIPEWPIVSDLIMIGCPIIIFISMSNVTGIQYMVPTGMYSQYSFSVILGSCINFVCNMMMIPRLGAYGAIVGSLIAEFTVTVTQIIFVRRKLNLHFKDRSYVIYMTGSAVMFGLVYGLGKLLPDSMISTVLQIMTGAAVYFAALLITKEELCVKVLSHVKERFRHA